MSEHTEETVVSGLPQGAAMQRNVVRRRTRGKIWRGVFLSSTLIGLIALALLLFTIINDSFGLIAVEYKVDPATLSERPLVELSRDELSTILQANISKNSFRTLERKQPMAERSQDEVLGLIYERVVKQDVAKTWSLADSLLNRSAIEAEAARDFPEAKLEFRSWLSGGFLTTPMSSNALIAGVRTALFGSLWMIGITILFAFPIGVGAAIYLEEYARDNRFNRIIQTNINNLAGVPSIIYGMLGLAVFVRLLEPVTSGRIFGVDGGNGRTILSASLTMMLLILPIIIINAQEAIRAVPLSLRQASYGLGATKWQTIRHHVLPNALPGILTGTILAVSRAIGETAPLIVVGASTFIVSDPDGPFSKFTALPIQIYEWTSRAQGEFANIAAAAIVVLLAMLLTLNSIAVLLRNRLSRRAS
jgi:phosphate transport system permease protein